MERESNDHIRKIISSIKSIISRSKMEPTPQNIIRYTSEAILNLQDAKGICDLTSVLIEGNFEEKGLRILKILLLNEEYHRIHLDMLLSLYFKKENKKKIKSVLEVFLLKCKDTQFVEESFDKLDDIEFLQIYEPFYEHLNKLPYCKRRLEKIYDKLHDIVDTSKRNKLFNMFFSSLLKYLNWLCNIDEVRDSICNAKKAEINDLFEGDLLHNKEDEKTEGVISLEKDNEIFMEFYKKEVGFVDRCVRGTLVIPFDDNFILLKIIGKLVKLDKIFLLRHKINVYKLDGMMKNFIKTVILGEDVRIKEIDKFIGTVKHILIPEFIDLIRELGSLYNSRKQDKYLPLLKSIVSHISFEELTSIVDIDYERWIPVLKCSVNNDLKVFIDLYHKIGNSKALSLLPSFCNFCTDNDNLILSFIDILKNNLDNSLYYCTICTGLKNILESHALNLKNKIYMRNEIPQETSVNIIRNICNVELFDSILRRYKEERIVRDLLFILIKKLGSPDSFNQEDVINSNLKIFKGDAYVLYNFIECFPQKEILQHKNMTFTSIVEVLKIFKFYVPLIDVNFEVVGKFLELAQNKDISIQKKSYEILYFFSKHNQINVCLCDALYSNEVVSSIKQPSMKYRLLFLYENTKNKCICSSAQQEKVQKLLQTIIICMHTANSSAQKVAEEILFDLIEDLGIEDILKLLERGIHAEDINIKSGVLCTLSYVLKTFSGRIDQNIKLSFYEYIFKVYKEINALVIIKLLVTYIKYSEDIVNKNITEILDFYVVSKKKKYRKDIKYVLLLLVRNGISVSKKLRRYLNYKIPTNKKILQITKKNDVIISEEMK